MEVLCHDGSKQTPGCTATQPACEVWHSVVRDALCKFLRRSASDARCAQVSLDLEIVGQNSVKIQSVVTVNG